MPWLGMRTFQKKVEKDEETVDEIVGDIVAQTAGLDWRLVHEMSPVDSSHYRFNWQWNTTGEDAFDERDGLAGVEFSAPLSGTELAEMEAMQSYIRDEVYVIVGIGNGTPYDPVLEWGLYGAGPKTSRGFSLMAVGGIQQRAIATIDAMFEAGRLEPEVDFAP